MTENDFTLDGFIDFLGDVHGHEPFPWQQRLVEQVLETRRWPAVLDVPTGLGKTSVIDVATYAAAAGCGPRRVFFVVDRRVVVDEAFTHAQTLAAQLNAVNGKPPASVRAVADGLRGLTGQDAVAPMLVTRMRGGVDWSWWWLDRPDRFAVVVGTVAQIGSRMLFRGYGLSPELAPIDAALVGTDAVVFVDEAHLAAPFLRTMRDIHQLDRPGIASVRRAEVVQLSATIREERPDAAPVVFDLAENRANPEAQKRLDARKVLVPVECPEKAAAQVMAQAAATAAARRPGGLVAVTVNTVDRAREVFDRIGRLTDADRVLLTGRSRPWDRERLMRRWSRRLTVGWRDHESSTRIVVATQTVECGANFDFDVLITESASWDATVQRIGRLNRVGDADGVPLAVVVHPTTRHDPIYGTARDETWTWLTEQVPARTWSSVTAVARDPLWDDEEPDGMNVSPAALRALRPPEQTYRVPGPYPTLIRDSERLDPTRPARGYRYLQGWATTAPVPVADAPVEPFLHGFDNSMRTVQVAWRTDITPAEPNESWQDLRRRWAASPERIPPSAAEQIELPLTAVRAWLSGTPAKATATDLGIDPAEESAQTRQEPGELRPVLVIDPPGSGAHATGNQLDVRYRVVNPDRLSPGDVIIVPSAYGGLDEYGWAPDSTAPVLDIADIAGSRRAGLRLRADTLMPLLRRTGGEDLETEITAGLEELGKKMKRGDEVVTCLDALATTLREKWWDNDRAEVWNNAESRPPFPRRAVIHRYHGNEEVLLVRQWGKRKGSAASSRREPVRVIELTGRVDGSTSASSEPMTLEQHHKDVAELAKEFAVNLGFTPELTEAIEIAAGWHDEGKLDPRFQAKLHHGSHDAAHEAIRRREPRAKSGIPFHDKRALRTAARLSGYPPGGCHEALSAVVVRYRLGVDSKPGLDHDLIVHLVAAHHGNGRPLMRPVRDDAAPTTLVAPDGEITLPKWSHIDWGSERRWRALCERYGLWTLALFESLVRLADIACSAGKYVEDEEKTPDSSDDDQDYEVTLEEAL